MSNEVQKDHIRNCINAAIAVWEFLSNKANTAPGEDDTIVTLIVKAEDLEGVCAPFFPLFPKLSEKQQFDLLDNFNHTFLRYELTSCGCFNFAHQLDHVYDLESLPSLDQH